MKQEIALTEFKCNKCGKTIQAQQCHLGQSHSEVAGWLAIHIQRLDGTGPQTAELCDDCRDKFLKAFTLGLNEAVQ